MSYYKVLHHLFIEEPNFFQALMAQKCWEALESSAASTLNERGYCEKIPLLDLGNKLWYRLVSLSQETQSFSYKFPHVLS